MQEGKRKRSITSRQQELNQESEQKRQRLYKSKERRRIENKKYLELKEAAVIEKQRDKEQMDRFKAIVSKWGNQKK
jgi:hypothetical protein